MEQQSIIISAVVLALILAGVLWYTLTQSPTTDVSLASPFPTPTATTGEVPPSASLEPGVQQTTVPTSDTHLATVQDSETSLSPTPATIQPTAYTGPNEMIFVIAIGSTLVGLWGLNEAHKRS